MPYSQQRPPAASLHMSGSSPNGSQRVAAYCRVSTKQDTLIRSLENQIEYYIATIDKRVDWQFMGMYVDRGRSGTSQAKRPGLQRLLRHCEAGKIDWIITKSISRFTRNTRDLLDILNRLRSWNVHVFFEREGIQTSQVDNDFILTVYAAVAQQEAANISQNVSWGFQKRFDRGIPKFDPIFGYDVQKTDHGLEISVVEEEAALVKEIFQSCLDGVPITELTRSLMERQIPTKQGSKIWRLSNVSYILRNERYLGKTVARRPRTSLISELSGVDQRRDEIVIPDTHPAIIEQDLFDQVQAKLDARKRPQKPKRKLELSSRVLCGVCGGTYTLNHQFGGKHGWMCARNVLDRSLCISERVWETDLKDLMVEAVNQRVGPASEQSVQSLQHLLLAIDETDHVEQQRLRYYRRILRIRTDTSEMSEAVEEARVADVQREFFEFEQTAAELESDREYRTTSLQDLATAETYLNDWASLSLAALRGMIRRLVVFDSSTALITWCDGLITRVGTNCPNEWPLNPIADPKQERALGTGARKLIRPDTTTILPQPQNLVSTLAGQVQQAKLRVCAYCRVSTAEELQQNSIAAQIGYYTHLILQNEKWELVDVFFDIGSSGTSTKHRPGFQEMIEVCQKGKVDLIITKSVSRFARNTVDCLSHVRMLKDLPSPVSVWFERENIHTGNNNGELTLTLYSSVAQEEAISAGENVRWGKKKLLERGIFRYTGTPSYGYTTFGDQKRWMVVPEEAAVVQRIFRETLAGVALTEIVGGLTRDHIPAPRGGHWWPSHIKKMLRNEAYVGDLLYQKTYIKDTLLRNRVKNEGELPQYLIQNHHPAIIRRDQWEEVQQLLRDRSKGQRNDPFLNYRDDFGGTFFCSDCGQLVSRYSRKTRVSRVYYRRCSVSLKRRFSTTCNARGFREESIECSFMILLRKLKHDKAWQAQCKARLSAKTETSPGQEHKCRLTAELTRLYRAIHAVVKDFGVRNDNPGQELSQLVQKVFQTRSKLKEIESSLEAATRLRSDFDWFVTELEALPDFNPSQNMVPYRRDIFERIVNKGTIHPAGTIDYELIFGDTVTAVDVDKPLWKLPTLDQ